MMNIFDRFKLLHEKENHATIIDNITKGVSFRGTNLWVLIFAILIASLGLNVNSTAVIIGAMLISPLMGPIMGMGLALGINDLALLRRSLLNFGYAVTVSLITSTIYFLITPLYDAHSEILARTYPTIYDVLIAFFGGLAGILATSSKLKGNVIPGVAIATALMPPLCTAGYGLATLQWTFFFGAAYLFIINSVFIAAATLLTVRLLKLPARHLPDQRDEKRAKRIIVILLLVTLFPSLYFGYDIVQQDRYMKQVNQFIDRECILPDDYLLNEKIDPKKKQITLTYGGKEIEQKQVELLQKKLAVYNLEDSKLEIKQGFSSLETTYQEDSRLSDLRKALLSAQAESHALKKVLDSINTKSQLGRQTFGELKILYPDLLGLVLTDGVEGADTSSHPNSVNLAILNFKKPVVKTNRIKMEEWLKLRLHQDSIRVVFE